MAASANQHSLSMQTSQNKKSFDPSLKDCANCGTAGAKLTCAKCKATHYCTKACQKQHWKNDHKALCITPEERRPHITVSAAEKNVRGPAGTADAEGDGGECPICLESFTGGTLCTLPCKHEFHRDCVEALRKQGVQQACPLCRVLLPPGPEKLFEDASRLYVRAAGRHRAVGVSWKPRSTSEEENIAFAIELFTTAANQGHIRAHHSIGYVYSLGLGVAQDYKKGMQWTQKAADQGLADAQADLGNMFYNGEGVVRNYKKAVQWYRKAADLGLALAQFNLGGMYHDGEGVAQDHNEAARWVSKAADQGLASAQFNLGSMYYRGQGVAQDHNEALRWFRKAADQGLADAQFSLGVIYQCGKGVARDVKKALFYLSAAEAQGDKKAGELRKHAEAGVEAIPLTASECFGLEASSPSKCTCCGRIAGDDVKLKPCPRCKGPIYCGKDCQSKHWKKGHKERCTKK